MSSKNSNIVPAVAAAQPQLDFDEELLRTFTCPITTEIMVDPVICPEGHSFERAAVEAWLRTHSTNPVTRNPLKPSQLSPNRALKQNIELFIQRCGGRDAASMRAAAATGAQETAVAALAANAAAASGTASTGPPKLPAAEGTKQGPGKGALPPASVGMANQPLIQLRVFDQEGQLEPALPGAPPVADGFHRQLVQIDILPPNLSSGRTPCDIVCVVDTSGSMCGAAKAKDADGNTEDTGLNVLDVTKHAVSTVIAVLGQHDRFALVSYSNAATVECSLTPMTDGGRRRASEALKRLQPSGSTNLWDGLQKGFDTLRAAASRGGPPRHQAILLLTDGCPNIVPPRGHLPTMRRYLDKFPLDCCVHTFGFGYSLDSLLLAQLAEEGNGQYSFIPDSGLVGTVFVNALSNILSTQAKNVKVLLEVEGEGVTIVKDALVGLNRAQETSWGIELALGTLNYGQRRSVGIHVDVPADAGEETIISGSVKLQFVQGCSSAPSQAAGGAKAESTSTRLGETSLELPEVALNGSACVPASGARLADSVVCRAALNNALKQAVLALGKSGDGDLVKSQRFVSRAAEFVAARLQLAGSKEDVNIKALLEDLQGECTLAFANAKDAKRWGRHFVPSLSFAHRAQRCNNFKDPGVQCYGGDLFTKVRDTADDTFLQLPPPTASRKAQLERSRRAQSTNSGVAYKPVRQVNMASYYNYSGGCIAPECLATLADGTTRRVADLRAGDVVKTGANEDSVPAVVRCVVQTATLNGRVQMAQLKGGALQITPWHPIRIGCDAAWQFPNTAVAGRTVAVECDHMYTFVLESTNNVTSRAAGLLVGGIECCALGHGVVDDAVLSHSFLGTSKVLQALEKCDGWRDGFVSLRQSDFIRDAHSNAICDIVQQK
eukprot:INCI814.1.p1 GENE.INCI814.1~~INCI814.1.p1  ORF type:complete len:892 (-),score=174.59 INCI814.1:1298-3973(-)